MSKTYPRRSQLTQSPFLSELWDIEDGIPSEMTPDEIESLAGELESLQEQCQDSLDNMPEALQDSSWSGELLTERIDQLEEWIEALRELVYNPPEATEDETQEELLAEAARDANPGVG